MSPEFIYFFAPGGGVPQEVVTALLRRGSSVRVHADIATLASAVRAPVGPGAARLVLLASEAAAACLAAKSVRRSDAGVAMAALLPQLDESVLIQAMHSGIDVCWPQVAAPALVVAGVGRLMGRARHACPGHRGSPVQAGHAWLLASRGWVVRAPDGASISLTSIERSILLALLRAPGQRLSHSGILAAISGEPRIAMPQTQGVAQARRLSVLISRMRRKFTATGNDMPIRSVRGAGYALCGDFTIQAAAVAPATAASETGP